MTFDSYIGIDYAGGRVATAPLDGLQVFVATPSPAEPFQQQPQDRSKWSREKLAEWLVDRVDEGVHFIAGIDHGFGLPGGYLKGKGLDDWPAFLTHFVETWPTDTPVAATLAAITAATGNPYRDIEDPFRLCEKWTGGAKPTVDFTPGPGVAYATHAGIPWLHHIRRHVGDRVHFWPFDGWEIPLGRAVIAEVYPALFWKRYPTVLKDHQRDAYSVARWLKETCERGILERYLHPPLTEEERKVAELEGWILGVC